MAKRDLYQGITREHVLQAIVRVNDEGYPPMRRSTSYDFVYEGVTYPPKYIMSLSGFFRNGEFIHEGFFTGGEESACFTHLRELGFEILPKSETKQLQRSAQNIDVKDKYFVELEYFTREEIDETAKVASQLYASDSPYLKHFKSIQSKLDYFVTHYIAQAFPEERLKICRQERINKQAGRGANHNKFTHYVLTGVSPEIESLGRTMFISFEITHKQGAFFKTKLDVDYASNQAKATEQLSNYVKKANRDELIPFDEIAGLGYEGLLKRILAETKRNIELYHQAYNYFRSQSSDNMSSPLQTKNLKKMSLNTILYGPPGTGKTYNSINHALAIIHGEAVSEISGEREDLKKDFDSFVQSGQIVFTTFHQSLSYEDFIEGIKPKIENNSVVYEIEDGLFKRFCNKARFISGNFENVLAKFKNDLIESGDETKYTIKAKTTEFYITYRGTNVFYVRPYSSTKQGAWYPINIDNIRKAFETDSYDKIYNPTYVREVITYLKSTYGLVKGNMTAEPQKKRYVFIIDEINRGNVSQIFGELITLIETSKREGASEELSVELPYSKQAFSVPDNVYILGTMNTADRSVEALDTALRRRFDFVFMPPDVTCIEEAEELLAKECSLKKLFTTLNERVKYLLDEDHQLGHSYFLDIKTVADLRHAFRNKIVPLLKEYFYNDYQKLSLVLGPGFVTRQQMKPTFAVKDDEIPRDVFTVIPIIDTFDILAAIKALG